METGEKEQPRAIRFWSKGCNPGGWLSPTETLESSPGLCNDRRGLHTPTLPHSEDFWWKLLAQFSELVEHRDSTWHTAGRGRTTADKLEEHMSEKSAVPVTAQFNVYSPRNPNKSCFPTVSFPRVEYHIIYKGGQGGRFFKKNNLNFLER